MVPPCLRLFFIVGEFRRLLAASFFLDGQKETKKPPGGRSDGRFAPIFTVPWTPVYGGRQCGNLAVNAKARVAQSIGFHSITAAAEVSVTFGSCFSWWIARLLAWWGSSAAQRDGVSGDDFRSPQGRPSVPPTVPRLRKPPCRAADSRPFPLHRKPVTAHGTRPPGFEPKTMARQTQAQKLNRSGNNFFQSRAPMGPD